MSLSTAIQQSRVGLGGVVDDDLPSVVGVLEDERKEAVGIAAILLVAVKVIPPDDHGEVLVERVDLEVGVGEGAHGAPVGIVMLVLIDKAGESAKDLMSDKEGVGRVLVAAGEGGEVALVPGVLLGDKDLNDAELLLGSGVERVWFLRGGERGRKKG